LSVINNSNKSKNTAFSAGLSLLYIHSLLPEFNNFNLTDVEKANYRIFLTCCGNPWLSPLVSQLSQPFFKTQGNQMFSSYQFNLFTQGRIWVLTELAFFELAVTRDI